mgnify:CR=1 FL=1
MSHFRFKGLTADRKQAVVEFEAASWQEAKKRVERISELKDIQIEALEKKSEYIYKVRRNGSKVFKGSQDAYNKQELKNALVRLGYDVDTVRKKWFNISAGVSKQEVVSFIRLTADLLRQNLSYNEILILLQEDTSNTRLKEVIKEIQQDLQNGKEGYEVYAKHEKIFGKFAAHMLGIASSSGNMAEVFESTAKFMEREASFKKNLRRSLMMPSMAMIAVIGVILFYVGYIFPLMAEMFLRFNITLPPMTAATLQFSEFLQTYWLLITVLFVSPIIGFLYFVKTPKGRLIVDKYLIRLPLVGELLHKMSIEIFSRVFYTLYSDSGQNVEVIRIAAEACRNTYMEQQINNVAVMKMLRDGTGLVEALEASGVFTRTSLTRFKMGSESGAIREHAKSLADYYEVETNYKLEAAVEMINMMVNILIAIALTVITVISSEAAIIQPNIEM